MALNHITFYSKLMEMEMGIDVIIPENKWGYSLAERPKDYKYPVLWLLCGGGFDYTDWQRYTAIELYAAQAGIAVVMPSAYYSGYMDTIHGDYKYFSDDSFIFPDTDCSGYIRQQYVSYHANHCTYFMAKQCPNDACTGHDLKRTHLY